MKFVAKYFLLFLVIIYANVSYAQKAVENKSLPNFHQVNANLYRGGQVNEEGIRQLKQMQIKTIISLRGADKRANTEENWAQNAGLKFINLPLNNWLEPSDAQIEKILAEINKVENQPVFVHCQRGADCTGTVIAVYRITQDGWTAKQANNEAKELGVGWWQFWMKDYINYYYRDFKKKS